MKATIKTKERIKNSVNGNPRYFVIAEAENGETLHGNTASDAGFCYGNWHEGQLCEIEYHHTAKRGNLIFDYIKETGKAVCC